MTPPTITELSLACLAASAVVVGNGEVQKGQIELPAEIVICPWGESRDLDGNPVIVNETTLAELGMNQTKYGFDEIAMDFEHGTVPKRDADGKAIAPSEPVPIAGMGTLSVREGVGIIYQPVSWTTAGEPAYTGRHFRDLSPTVSKNEKGEVIFVHSVALCRNGQIRDLHAFSTPLSFSTALSTTTETKTKTMDAPNYRDLLRLKLALPEDATDEQIVGGMDSLSVTAKVEEKTPETTPMAAAGTPEVTALAARMDQMEKDNLVLQGTAAGKIIPLSADALKLTPLSVVRELVEKATPGAVPTTSSIAKKDPPRAQALSAEEKVVAARMGYSEEKWRELNPIA